MLYRILSVDKEGKVKKNKGIDRLHSGLYLDSSHPNKPGTKGLSLLGYDNVKGTPIHPKLRQELEYIDREV